MNDLQQRIADIDWQAVTKNMNKGYSKVSQFLPIQNCDELIDEYDNFDLYSTHEVLSIQRTCISNCQSIHLTSHLRKCL
jgi:hypothetical protein